MCLNIASSVSGLAFANISCKFVDSFKFFSIMALQSMSWPLPLSRHAEIRWFESASDSSPHDYCL